MKSLQGEVTIKNCAAKASEEDLTVLVSALCNAGFEP